MTLREWSLSFPLPLVLLKVRTIKAKYSGGLVFPLQDTRAGEPHMGLISLAIWGEPLQL